jgi:hypothetical protein
MDVEAQVDINGEVLDPIQCRPSEYWRTHCFATFQNDRLGLSRMNIIGDGNAMWAPMAQLTARTSEWIPKY